MRACPLRRLLPGRAGRGTGRDGPPQRRGVRLAGRGGRRGTGGRGGGVRPRDREGPGVGRPQAHRGAAPGPAARGGTRRDLAAGDRGWGHRDASGRVRRARRRSPGGAGRHALHRIGGVRSPPGVDPSRDCRDRRGLGRQHRVQQRNAAAGPAPRAAQRDRGGRGASTGRPGRRPAHGRRRDSRAAVRAPAPKPRGHRSRRGDGPLRGPVGRRCDLGPAGRRHRERPGRRNTSTPATLY